MDILELSGPHGHLRISCVVIDKTKSPVAAEGYQHLHYSVGGHGFSGEGDGFVAEEHLRVFCTALIALAEGRDVKPQLSEYYAGGLTVELCAGPKQNQISVEGRIVKQNYRTLTETDGLYTWGTQFGFWITRDALSGVRNSGWVRHFTC